MLLFDVGVYLVVARARSMLILFTVAEEEDAA